MSVYDIIEDVFQEEKRWFKKHYNPFNSSPIITIEYPYPDRFMELFLARLNKIGIKEHIYGYKVKVIRFIFKEQMVEVLALNQDYIPFRLHGAHSNVVYYSSELNPSYKGMLLATLV
jgi:hypothetical protein